MLLLGGGLLGGAAGTRARGVELLLLRGEADKSITDLVAAVKANKDPLTVAKAADAKLDELRRLFFNVVEHLQDLIRRQGETRDQTNAAQAEDEVARAPKLPDLDSRESEHGQLAKAITDKLAEMADAAGKQPQQQPQGGQPSAKNLADATAEVRLAQGDMSDAKGQLDKAISTKNQSFSLDPTVKSQAKAIEHLENALRLLQPPKQQQQDKDQDKKKQEQQQQQQQQQGGAGQRARDMDAERQKDKQQRQSADDAVDKDW